ncbi:MAG: leucine-rich repeat domain-containing protein [Salinivirgaceae bacterium]|nr:leucine-rich repeat domain-containing protein [Salinivirgaceae bacterium]
MKRIFIILFAAMLAGQAWAEDFKSGDLCYNITSNTSVEVTYEINGNNYSRLTNVTIPKTVTTNSGVTYTVTGVGEQAFRYCNSLTSITIPDNITTIGKAAFEDCSGLTQLTIPESVKTIGRYAFSGCSGLKSITIPKSVTSIDKFAFYDCNNLESLSFNTNAIGEAFRFIYGGSKLKTVNVGDFVTKIPNSAFAACENLTTVNFSNSVTIVDDAAFYYCTGLESIAIPNSVKEIRFSAFEGCTGLKSIIISDSLKTLESHAFINCSSLASIVIPEATTTVGNNVFYGCNNLTIYCEAESKPKGWDNKWNPNNRPVIWGAKDGAYLTDNFTFEIIDNELLTAKITSYTGTNPNVIIPHKATINGKEYKVTTIGNRVFDSNSTLRSVFIPHTISNVESLAFGKNHYDAKIFCEAAGDDNTVPDGWASNWYGTSVPAIAYNAHIENGFVYQITDSSAHEAQIIRYMGEKDTVAVPEKINGGTYNVNSIAGYAFYECKAMKAIDIPSSVAEIGNYAFYGSSNIELLTYNTNAIGTNFQNRQSLKKVVIGNNVTKIDDWTFSHTGLEEITFSTSVKTVGSNAFSGCSKLKKVDFASIESLCEIEFDIYESNPMEIAHSLYINSNKIVELYIPTTVKSIGDRTFSGCSNLTKVVIPKSVNSIGEKAFLNCSNLTIFCEAASQPNGWNENWNPDNRPVVWKLYTDKKIRHAAITSNNNEYGNVEGGGYLIDSTETTISATPAQGYHFTSWSDNNIENPRVIKATSDTLLTALFEAHTIVVDSAVSATCTESGLTEGSHCSVCNEVLVKQDTTAALGHTVVVDAAIAATCTEAGKTEGKHCSVCNEMLIAQTEIPALGHEFVNYIYNNDATTEADGTETAICENGCGETDTRVKEGTKLPKDNTAVYEYAAYAINIYAHRKTIVVENATDEISVYDAMGRLVGRDAINRVRAELTVNGTGVYIVKTGGVVKRVMVN